MERTKTSNDKNITNQQLMTFASQIVGRANLASQLGLQYGGDRDIYKALGYKSLLTYDDFAARYSRQDIAKAIIDRPVKSTWQGKLELVESELANDTEFEEAWESLDRRLGIKTRLSTIDKLTGIGRYGILLLGLDDVKDKEGFEIPVNTGSRKLLYVKPFGEKSSEISTFVTDTKNDRYGMPLIYNIEVADVSSGSSMFVKVHYSRVIHIIDDPMESEVFGTPRLEVVFNRLMDLEKLVGGDAEMFWRNARPGFQGKVDSDYQMTPAMKEDLKDQIDEYENFLRRMLVNEGVTWEALKQEISNPSSHVDVQIQMISAVTGIPKRILTGSEQGELASTQDSSAWKDYVQARREDHAEPCIIRPFVDRLIELKVLPKPKKDYTVKWADLYAMSEKAMVEVGKGRANALREYLYSPMAQAIIPPKGFFEYFLGLTKEKITLIEAMRDEVISEEELSQKIIDELTPKETVVTPNKNMVTIQKQKDNINWKKLYEDGGAHWTEDLQPSKCAQDFAEKLVEEKKKSILEIGCGNGRDSILFASAGLKVTSIDIVPEAVELAKENAKNAGVDVDFQEGNAEKLTFKDSSFDAVYSLSVLHSTKIEKSLAEITRVLKTGGKTLIYVYSNVQKINGTTTEFISLDDFIGLFKDNNFTIEDIYTDQEEEYSEIGEKYFIIIIQAEKNE